MPARQRNCSPSRRLVVLFTIAAIGLKLAVIFYGACRYVFLIIIAIIVCLIQHYVFLLQKKCFLISYKFMLNIKILILFDSIFIWKKYIRVVLFILISFNYFDLNKTYIQEKLQEHILKYISNLISVYNCGKYISSSRWKNCKNIENFHYYLLLSNIWEDFFFFGKLIWEDIRTILYGC